MRFEHPELLNWLWAVLPIAGFFAWAVRRCGRTLERFVHRDLLSAMITNARSRRYVQQFACLVAVFFFSVLALARPQWGFEWQEVKREGLDIILVIDTSKSMLTQDVKPNRLERCKLAVKDLLKKLNGDRIGLVAFAGSAFLTCPLTVDYNGFLLSLDDLNVDTIPRGGSNFSAAIEEAVKAYEKVPAKNKAVIILTDGENLEDDPSTAIKKAKEKGIKIYTIGIGTTEGELIELASGDFLKDSAGNYVKSRLNEKLLQEIALATGGIYVRSSGAEFGLDLVYEKELSKFEKREFQIKMEKRFYERYQVPIGIAFIFLIVAGCIPERHAAREKS